MFIHKYKFLSLVPLGATDDQLFIILSQFWLTL